jgi:hypothetical protein
MLSMIELHGKKILEEHDLSSKRIIGEIENYDGFYNNLLSKIINTIPHFCLHDVTYYLKKRSHKGGFSMKWHVDDDIVMNVPNENLYPDIAITDTEMLVYRDQKSTYTLLLYESSYGEDFHGGTLEFVDGTIIEPKRGMYVLFDSREVYRVNKITGGDMNIILITFYR